MSVSLFGFVGEHMKPTKCVTTYGLYSDSYHPTGLKGSMVIWKTTKITIHAKNNTKSRQRRHIIYSLAFLLALAGDIETNPGPQTKYPCGVCSKAVIRKGVACDTCDQWYHPKCMGMRDLIYKNLGHASWHCCNCALPNISDFLQTPIESSTNSFDCLNTTISSVSNIESQDQNYSPVARSSPLTQAQRVKRQKRSLKVCIVNFQSVKNKKADIRNLIKEEDPDIIAGTETWLNTDIASAEFFPANYQVLRQDRLTSSHGGALLALKSDLTVERIDSPNNIEAVFAKVKTQLHGAPLVVGSIYRPTNNDQPYMELLNKTIIKICKSHRKSAVWLCGDLNLPDICWDQLNVKSHQYATNISQTFLDTVINCGMVQMVDENTRENKILDLFLTNRPTWTTKCSTRAGISDHDIVITTNQLAAQRRKPISRKILLWKKANITELRNDVSKLKDRLIEEYRQHSRPINDLWIDFVTSIKRIESTHVPSKMSSVRHHQPWVNRNIKQLGRRKRRAYQRAKTSGKQQDWDIYKEVKKAMRHKCKETYNQFMSDLMTQTDDHQIHNKRFWKYIKSRRCDQVGISTLKDEIGRSVTDGDKKANLLNQQFASVFTIDDLDPLPAIPQKHDSMPAFDITDEGIEKLLKNLKDHKASGPDNLSPLLLKSVAAEVSPILNLIFNTSLRQGAVPKDWQHANVCPIYKKGDPTSPGNYRPVSLTSIPCKIMEHIISSQINRHLEHQKY